MRCIAIRIRRLAILGMVGTCALAGSACRSPGQWASLVKENQSLRENMTRLEGAVAERDGTISSFEQQVDDLTSFGPDRPADAFAPVKLEIASLSGGADFDGQPGDDGVIVYLRPKDADGDTVKVPGRISIQLLDNSALDSPRVVGVYTFDEITALRKMWYGLAGTQHYTVHCPFPAGVDLPRERKLLVSAVFVDFLTGRSLTAHKEVSFAGPPP